MMVKIFTIKDYKFKEMSQKKASIDYLLVDEQGIKRTVTAVAKLGRNNKIRSIKPVFERETPLVAALASRSVNDQVVVDFTGYNKKYPRIIESRTRAINGDFVKTTSSHNSRHNVYEISKLRLFQLFLISIFCLFLIVLAQNFTA